MGIEVAFGVAALAVGLISGANQMRSAGETRAATNNAVAADKKAAEAQKETNRIIQAATKNNSLEQRRQKIREERLRRAQLLQAGENTNGGGSSGESGAISSLSANLAGQVAGSRSEGRANTGVNKYQQKSLDYQIQSRSIMANAAADAAEADAFSSFLNIFSTGLRSF